MPKALFVTYGGGHVAMAIPAIQEMRRRGWKTTVLGLTTAGKRLRAAGIPFLGFRDLLRPDDHRALAHGERLLKENHTINTDISTDESIAYLGLSYADLEDRVGIDEARRQYAEKKRHAFLPVGPLTRLIQSEKPDVVIATSSPRAERASILAAKELGIPSVVMMDLFGKEWDYFYDPGYGDTTLVFAPIVFEDYLRRGRSPSNLIMTGNPSFDRLASPGFAEEGLKWRVQHGLSGKQVILWAATSMLTAEHRLQVLRELSNCVTRNPDWTVLFRPHPSMGEFQGPFPPGCMLVDNRIDLAIHLHAADCVMVTISTCGIEAALLDKPVIKLRFVDPSYSIFDASYPRMDALAPYEEMGIAAPVMRLEDLEPTIVSVLPGGSNAESLRLARRSLPSIGTATAKVADAIVQTVAQYSRRKVADVAAA
jgi:hypothetical protein